MRLSDKPKTYTLKLTKQEVWALRESFEAAFTDPNARSATDVAVSDKLSDLLQRSRRDSGGFQR